MKVINKQIKFKFRYKKMDYIYFSVYVNKKGRKGHSEVYRYYKLAYNRGLKKGYNTKTKAFFDFKRIDGKNVSGLYKVQSIYTDNKKVYYRTKHGIYSLPLYLKDKVPNNDYILVAERVKKNEV